MVDTSLAVGKRISKIRKKCKLTQLELAKSVGISKTTISKIENGKIDFDIFLLSKLCSALSVSCDYIVNGIEAVPHYAEANAILSKLSDCDKEKVIELVSKQIKRKL